MTDPLTPAVRAACVAVVRDGGTVTAVPVRGVPGVIAEVRPDAPACDDLEAAGFEYVGTDGRTWAWPGGDRG